MNIPPKSSIDQSGLVTVNSTGSKMITAISMNGNKLATCEIVVL